MSALSAMQEKTQHLENSLSAETRIKLDLFSALGDAKRQLEIAQGSYLSATRAPLCLRLRLLLTPAASSPQARFALVGTQRADSKRLEPQTALGVASSSA